MTLNVGFWQDRKFELPCRIGRFVPRCGVRIRQHATNYRRFNAAPGMAVFSAICLWKSGLHGLGHALFNLRPKIWRDWVLKHQRIFAHLERRFGPRHDGLNRKVAGTEL